jgi:hypothetical protein
VASLLAGVDDALVSEARVYYGKVPASDQGPAADRLGRSRRTRAPLVATGTRGAGMVGDRRHDHHQLPVWEISPRADTCRLRRILMLTPEQRYADFSRVDVVGRRPQFATVRPLPAARRPDRVALKKYR